MGDKWQILVYIMCYKIDGDLESCMPADRACSGTVVKLVDLKVSKLVVQDPNIAGQS